MYQPSTTPAVIVIADDDEANRYVLAQILKKAGYTVREATTAADGLALAHQRPDLILLDVNLPDMNGLEVCRRLKADPELASIPVIQMSARFTTREDRVAGLQGGADGYLTAPVEPREVLAMVQTFLRLRQAEERALAVSRQWQHVFDSINDGVCLLDRGGIILRCNRTVADLAGGLPFRELVGRPHAEVLGELVPSGDETPFARMLQSGQRERCDVARGEQWFRVTADPICDAAGNITGGVLALSDISERKRLEDDLRRHADQLAEGDRRKNEFLAMLAHELRNPLAPIRNAAQLLRAPDAGGQNLTWARGVIERQVQHLARLVDDLLDVSRITRGKIDLRRHPSELAAIVGRAVETSRPLIEARRHTLTVTLPDQPVWVHADALRLAQVVANLLNNAAKYTADAGHIDLAAAEANGEVVLRVRDNGVGMTPETLAHAFDLFAQADRSLDRSQGGLGIGLTLVKRLVELHGGRVEAHSDGPGKGSVFTVRLPALARPPEADDQLVEPAESPPPARRILIVDDNVDAAETLALLLRIQGNDVQTVHDGSAALRAAELFRPEVVFLDIGLPGMDGYEVARALRAMPDLAGVRLVALTGYGKDEDRYRAREAGFDVHLVKPVDPERLEQILTGEPAPA